MTNTCKIVFIGAGSASFGVHLFRDLFQSKQLAGCTLTLVDTNPETLERMYGLAQYMNKRHGAGILIERTTDRRAALRGAHFVLNSVAIDRTRLWRMDFEVPKKYGVRHTLGENGGPGGLFFTMRTLPLIFDFVRDMEELCPDAFFLNYSNPESRIVLALGKYSPIRSMGLCHGIFLARWYIGTIMGMADKEPEQKLDLWAAGLNHFQCVMQIRDRETGKDMYPLLLEKDKTFDPSLQPLTRKMMRAFGHWITCSDDHMGEYIPYGYEGGEKGFDFDGEDNWRIKLQGIIDDVVAGKQQPPDEWNTLSGERGIAVIESVMHNQKRMIESGIVYNRGVIPNLPADLAVEVPIVADAAGLHPVSLGPLPDPIAKLMTMQASVQQLAVEAAVHASKELALEALLIDPVMNSTNAAHKILDELWEANLPYIRKCV
ncbi:MAG: alpha-glucosidase/alpha-galactosidase [Rhodospirillales bacterium]|nr:alpha-glucosidase/alpha-galactosidase [Rhodospirillales bacterium]